MRLLHYSHKQIEFSKDKEYDQSQVDFHSKPNGLWVSVEGSQDWKEWCKAESYGLYRLRFSYEVTLKQNSNILHIKTPLELLEFTKKYPFLREQWNDPVGKEICSSYELDWTKVKKDYQGIIIAPYQWDCRCACETVWYYGWDCSSGCIWDLNCIESFTFVKEDLEIPTEPDKKPCLVTLVRESLISSAQFLCEDDHKEHEYEFCERTIFTSIQYLKSKRKSKEHENVKLE